MSISARRWPRRSIRAIASSRRSTTRRAPGRPRTRSASAAPICACTAWRARAAISLSGAPCRCGIAIARPRTSRDGKQWLLRFFDQIRFYPVSAEELLKMRRRLSAGALRAARRADHAEARRPAPLPCRERRVHRRVQGASAGCIRGRARALEAIRRRRDRRRSRDAAAPPPRWQRCRRVHRRRFTRDGKRLAGFRRAGRRALPPGTRWSSSRR